MKRSLLVILLFALVLFVGCNEIPPVQNIVYEIDMELIGDEVSINDFTLEDVRIKATYQNGDFFYISVEESMILEADLAKLEIVGEHEITVIYKNFTGGFHIILSDNSIIIPDDIDDPDDRDDPVGLFESEMAYYQAAIGKSGTELKSSLRSIISVTKKTTTYNDLRQDIAKTDVDPNNANNIIMIYTGASLPSKWDNGATWTREHVWPQSLSWFTTSGAGADLHHLRPCEPGVNSSRGNKRYGETTNSTYYEPRDEVKGDVARILFYLYVRYEQADAYALNRVAQSFDMLLAWNEADPVDSFEIYRNEKTYEIQGNRNPFIDHPECAKMIWSIKVVNFDEKQEIIITIVWYNEKQKETKFKEDRI